MDTHRRRPKSFNSGPLALEQVNKLDVRPSLCCGTSYEVSVISARGTYRRKEQDIPSVRSLNVWKRALDDLGYLARKQFSSGY